MLSYIFRAFVLLAVVFAVACGKPTGVPQPSPGNAQKLPFDRASRANGISPSQTLIPPTKRLVEGTTLTTRLRQTLSSANAQSGTSFSGTLDEPVEVDGQPLIARGALVTGRVLDAKPSASGNPGYLRIALVSVNVADKPVLIETSSIFVKGVSPTEDANHADVVFSPDRRLSFRLAQPTDLP